MNIGCLCYRNGGETCSFQRQEGTVPPLRPLLAWLLALFTISCLVCHVFHSPEPCSATWTVYANSNVFGGSRLSTANSVTTCLQGCKTNIRCRGADYNSANLDGWRCFLQFSDAYRINMGTIAGVYHYSISRVCIASTMRNYLLLLQKHTSSLACNVSLPRRLFLLSNCIVYLASSLHTCLCPYTTYLYRLDWETYFNVCVFSDSIYIFLLTPTTVAWVKRLAASVCVCVFVRTIKPKRLKVQ